MRSAGKPILGVRWCAWDDAEALEVLLEVAWNDWSEPQLGQL